jgi:DNA uptake protein ComE-like DNA-binding protein
MNYDNLRKIVNEITDIVHKERNVVIGFLLFFIGIQGLKYYFDNVYKQFDAIQIEKIDIPKSEQFYYQKKDANDKEGNSTPRITRLFVFDPNTVNIDDLLTLGFPPKTAYGLVHWREKGKVFKSKEDVQKVYGLPSDFFQKIAPYISISAPFQQYNQGSKPDKPRIIDINTASAEDWEILPGIGSSYARRIMKFRDILGGFYAIDQVAETFNLPDSSFQKCKPFLTFKTNNIKKLNVNTATHEDLSAHPYISINQANAIIKERPIYGEDDLYEIYQFQDKAKTKKLLPYLTF